MINEIGALFAVADKKTFVEIDNNSGSRRYRATIIREARRVRKSTPYADVLVSWIKDELLVREIEGPSEPIKAATPRSRTSKFDD